jgi:protein FAM50
MGDFQANFRRPVKDSGIHTVEGNVAGARAAALVRQRELDQQAYEEQVLRQKAATANNTAQFNAKFSGAAGTATSITEETFLEATVGLVTAEEFKRLQQAKDDHYAKVRRSSDLPNGAGGEAVEEESSEAKLVREKAEKKTRKRKLKEKRQQMATLSFTNEEEDDEVAENDDDGNNDAKNDAAADAAVSESTPLTDEVLPPTSSKKQNKKKKDPSVNTSFLPDRDRERLAQETRERLEREWVERQHILRNEPLEVVYSYWDGSGHRRSIKCKKGDTIGTFLEAVRMELAREFRELFNIASDALIYVKEDLMLPHDLTFYDLIVSKARGKSGPLFHFDVHDDVRVGALDARIEKDESHPGKIVQRHWYERNKHIFPASRWEHFDPAKDYGGYTIGGQIVTTS